MQDIIRSGIPGFDEQINTIEPGDNVVWKCTRLVDFKAVMLPLVQQNIFDNRKVIYLRFAQHRSLLKQQYGVEVHRLKSHDGFESFTFQVYDIIKNSGSGNVYIFDCLSDLPASWSADLMMSNFFRIICPYLSTTKNAAYFPIIRGQHSYEAIDNIKQTAQFFINLYQKSNKLYFHLLKNRDRSIDKEYFQYQKDERELIALSDPAATKKIEAKLAKEHSIAERDTDIWERYFSELKTSAQLNLLPPQENRKICRRLMTRDPQMEDLIVNTFTPADYFAISDRLIGTGKIGGKSCGLLLGRKLIQKHLPELKDFMEGHDSFYIGADVFYTYMVENHCWTLRLEHRLQKHDFDEIDSFKDRLLQGHFPEYIRAQFCKMLEAYGPTPIIVRSSSFLEDGYGNAFSGKYESVFCANIGTMEERLLEFETAVRKVYASTLSPSALEYRKKRKVLDQDEQMALLVQKVSGTCYGNHYFPLIAGVGFSYNPYKWMEYLNPKAGMLRIVTGLGTRAVERTPGDYPRLIGLDRPQATLWASDADRHKHSQRQADVLNLITKQLESIPLETIIGYLSPAQKKMVLSHDQDAEARLMEQGRYRPVYYADCQGVVNNRDCLQAVKQILRMLEDQYERPVDIEFTINIDDNGMLRFQLLQCRPLQKNVSEQITRHSYDPQKVLFDIKKASMRRAKEEKIDWIVIVDPRQYYEFPYREKNNVAKIIGNINYLINGRNCLLLVPGRIGTSSPELGVPVTYAEISQFKAICEVSYSAVGYQPELSYGSHMFQDLVEADVFYGAIHENSSTKLYQPEILNQYTNLFPELFPNHDEYKEMIKIFDVTNENATLTLFIEQGQALCQITGRDK